MMTVEPDRLSMLEQAFAATSVGVLILETRDDSCAIIRSNPAFEKITGYSTDEVIGRSLAILDGPETEAGDREQVDAAIRGGQAVEVLIRHHRKDGTAFWNQLSLSPITSPDGTVTQWVAVVNEDTKSRPVQERVEGSEWVRTEISGSPTASVANVQVEMRSLF